MLVNLALTWFVDVDIVPGNMDGICYQYVRQAFQPVTTLPSARVGLRARFCANVIRASILSAVMIVGRLLNPDCATAQNQSLRSAASEITDGIVLLKNGQLIEGQAMASVDRTVVETKSGSRIFLKTDDIRFICNSWQEAWEYQRDAVNIDDSQELVELMQWCLRYHLLVEARQVFDRLALTKITAIDLDHFHRMVLGAEKAWETKQIRLLEGQSGQMMVNRSNTAPQNSGDKIQDGNISPASFVTESNPKAIDPVVSAKELDSFSSRITNSTLESFRHDVEPLMLCSCSNAGCHGPTASRMPLMSLGNGQQPPLRMSQQNLYWTARQLLKGDSGCETFLKMAVTNHGGQSLPAIRPDSIELERIRSWAREFCSNAEPGLIDFSNDPVANSNSVSSIRIPGASHGSLADPHGSPQRSIERDAPKIPLTEKPMLDFPKIPDLANSSNQFVPVDEFDPQIFNRFFRELSGESSGQSTQNQARSLGLPDLQSLIGKEKTPDK